MTALPSTMTAITIDKPGGPEALTPKTVDVPAPGPGQLLVKVAAAGVNRPDVMQRRGLYPAPKGHSEFLVSKLRAKWLRRGQEPSGSSRAIALWPWSTAAATRNTASPPSLPHWRFRSGMPIEQAAWCSGNVFHGLA